MGLISRVSSRTYRVQMTGRFVHGGIQKSQLGNDEENEYLEEKTIKQESDEYQKKLAEASDKLSSKTTEDILKDAGQFREKQRDKYNNMYGYGKSESGRTESKESGRSEHSKDDLRHKIKRKRSDSDRGSPDYSQ